ncbi:MAG: hypothetical protein N3I35_11975 [Clostridia bacterium]|nr:hypothetical protein [Clostridia bacterium]
MRNLKKFLAIVVAIAVMMTAMVPAFAAETTMTDAKKAETLKVLRGGNDGVTDAYLATESSRFQSAMVLLRLVGKYDAAEAFDATGKETFKDQNLVGWEKGKNILAYLKAHPEFGFTGIKGGTEFGVNQILVPQQAYKILLQALGYTQTTATVKGDYEYSKILEFAAEKGLTKIADLTKVTNNDLAVAIVETLAVKVKGTEKTLVEKLVEEKVIAQADAETTGLIKVTALSATAAPTGAKKLTVTFNQAVDSTKATFDVKKGTIAVTKKETTWDSAKKAATIELNSKMTAGDYTVTVGGIEIATKEYKVTVKDETVTKITLGTTLVMDRSNAKKATTGYKVYNQYDEEITNGTALTISAGKAQTSATANGSNATITLDNTGGADFAKDEKVAVTAIHVSSGTNASAVLTVVDKASVAEIAIEKLWNADGKTLTAGGGAEPSTNFFLVVTAKDQYGNEVTSTGAIEADVIVTVSDSSKVDVKGGAGNPDFETKKIDDKDRTVLALADTQAEGTSTVRMIAKSTAKMASFDVVVKAAVKADSFTFTAPDVAVAGEKFNIPFSAVDQFGAALTDETALDLVSTKTFTFNGYSATVDFKRDHVKGVTNLEIDTTTANSTQKKEGTGTLTIVTQTGKIYTLTVAVKDPAKCVAIGGIKDLTTTLAKGATVDVTTSKIIVKDQYGRDITAPLGTAAGVYRIIVESSATDKVYAQANDTIRTMARIDGQAGTDKVVLEAKAKGTSTVTIKLQKGDGTAIDNTEYTFTVTVVEKADVASYELAAMAKAYVQDPLVNDHGVEIVVNGVKADGTKVAVPSSYYSVQLATTDTNVQYKSAANRVYAYYGASVDSTSKEATIPVVVTVFGANGPVVVTGSVVISTKVPEIADFYLADTDTTVASGFKVTDKAAKAVSIAAGDITNAATLSTKIIAVLRAKDQYGADYTVTASDIAASVTSNISTSDRTISGVDGSSTTNLQAGDTFSMTVITKTNKVLVIKVVVV